MERKKEREKAKFAKSWANSNLWSSRKRVWCDQRLSAEVNTFRWKKSQSQTPTGQRAILNDVTQYKCFQDHLVLPYRWQFSSCCWYGFFIFCDHSNSFIERDISTLQKILFNFCYCLCNCTDIPNCLQ